MSPTSDLTREAQFEGLVRQLDALFTLNDEPTLRDVSPARIAVRIRSEIGVAAAIKGAKMAINDALEMLEGATPQQWDVVNRRLLDLGCPPLNVLMAGRARVVRRILIQGQLNSDLEYYLLREVVLGPSTMLNEDQRKLASSMLEAYEGRAGGAA
jgi:hypothetical protein